MIENRFTKAIEQDIEKYLDTLSFDSLNHCDLLSPQLKRAKMKYEILESVEHSEFNQQIQLAFVILKNEGAEFLSQEEYEEMSNNLASAATILASIDTNKEIIINYKEILGISDRTIEACSTMANAKFNAELYSDALALSLLMVIFVPNNAFYLYRVGLSAQNVKKYDFAIKSYSAAVEIYPNFMKHYFLQLYVLSHKASIQKQRTPMRKLRKLSQKQLLKSLGNNYIKILKKS